MRHDRSSAFVAEANVPLSRAFGKPVAVQRAAAPELKGSVRLLTCGSVDDGKSTLIGRLLWDASALHDDQREKLLKQTASLHGAVRPDFSRLVDGLMAEQEQGITIDIAWHYFDLNTKRFVIIDSPGHEQYTRNMATGASHADVAILLVDARSGIKEQTRRHLAILDLTGVRKVVLAVNKMDLVSWSQECFEAIVGEFEKLAGRFPGLVWEAIPVSALNGDNVATRSQAMDWYAGSTLLQYLEGVPHRGSNVEGPFRMPVQLVLRDGDFRGLAGTIASGQLSVSDTVFDALSGRSSRVSQIRTMDGPLLTARSGQAVVIQLVDHIDISRGSILTNEAATLQAARVLDARLIWLSNDAFAPSRGYLLRTPTDAAAITNLEITGRLDLDTLEVGPATSCEPNNIVEARITLSRNIAADLFGLHPETGIFVLVDAATGAAAAAGVIRGAHPGMQSKIDGAFTVTADMLRLGLCADLRAGEEGDAEFRRRANELAIILRAAGVAAEIDI